MVRALIGQCILTSDSDFIFITYSLATEGVVQSHYLSSMCLECSHLQQVAACAILLLAAY